MIGEYISNKKNLDVLKSFVMSFDFRGLRSGYNLRHVIDSSYYLSDPVGLSAFQDPDPAIYVNADPGLAITLEVKISHFFFPFFQNFNIFSFYIILSYNFLKHAIVLSVNFCQFHKIRLRSNADPDPGDASQCGSGTPNKDGNRFSVLTQQFSVSVLKPKFAVFVFGYAW